MIWNSGFESTRYGRKLWTITGTNKSELQRAMRQSGHRLVEIERVRQDSGAPCLVEHPKTGRMEFLYAAVGE